MSSFFSNLAKGFVRSAVNQVGRDGGRVISNAIYGDKHSTPFRNVSGNNAVVSGVRYGEPKVMSETRQNLQPTFGRLVFCIVLAFAFNIIGVLFLLYNGLKRMYHNKIKVTVYGVIPTYIQDLRNGGEFYCGDQPFTNESLEEPTEEERATDRKVGKIYLIAAGVILAIYIAMLVSVGNS